MIVVPNNWISDVGRCMLEPMGVRFDPCSKLLCQLLYGIWLPSIQSTFKEEMG